MRLSCKNGGRPRFFSRWGRDGSRWSGRSVENPSHEVPMSKSKKSKGTLERVTETVSGAAEAVWDAGASAIESVSGALPGAKSSTKKKSSKAKSSSGGSASGSKVKSASAKSGSSASSTKSASAKSKSASSSSGSKSMDKAGTSSAKSSAAKSSSAKSSSTKSSSD